MRHIVALLIFLPLIIFTHSHPLTTSLIIPCSPSHAPYLYDLLKTYENQTELPDEVIIALSSCAEVEKSILDSLHNQTWRFSVNVLACEEKQFAGENRNRASRCAKGDLFIFQDADDIPHPQRIEIIKYFFRKYPIKHLIHGYLMLESSNDMLFERCADFETIPFFYVKKRQGTTNLPGTYTNGNVSILKEVAETIAWPDKQRGQDTIFNRTVYEHFDGYCAAINISLLTYRKFLSSYKGPCEHVIAAKKRIQFFVTELNKELNSFSSLAIEEKKRTLKNKLRQVERAQNEISSIANEYQEIEHVKDELKDLNNLTKKLEFDNQNSRKKRKK